MKIPTEKIFLIILFIILFFAGIARPFDYQLVHDKPYGFGAADAYTNYVVAEALREQGAWKLYPSYFASNFDDCIAFNPPLLYQISVILSQIADIPLWDALYFLIILTSIVAIMAIFFLIKKHFNITLAYLSIPLSAILFTGLHFNMFSWGIWTHVLSSTFLIAMFFFIDKRFFVILLLIAMIHTHTSEFIFAVGFIGIYVLFKKFSNIKEQTINIVTAMGLSFYYLWIFYNTWMETSPFKFAPMFASENTGMRVMMFGDFGWIFGILIILGIILILVSKKINVVTLVGFYMILIGYTNLIGFSVRAFQTRNFWPLYLAVFMGYPIYLICTKIKLLKKIIPLVSIVILIMLLILNPVWITKGILIDDRWDALQWMKENTGETEKNLFFYSQDLQQASILWMSKRMPYMIESDALVEWLSKGRPRYFKVREIAEGKANYAYWDGWKVKYHWFEPEINQTETHIRDLCDFDYYHLSGYNQVKELTEVHDSIAAQLMSNNMQVVYKGEGILIIKNLDRGADCLV